MKRSKAVTAGRLSAVLVGAAGVSASQIGSVAASHAAVNSDVSGVMSESQALAAGALDESLTPLPDGGTEYSYWVPADPSSVVNVPIPPAGFTPVDASAAQLAEYGFPVRPTDSTALATWTQEMSTYQTRLVPDPTLDFSSPIDGFDHEPPPADYANWGGYISKLLPGELADPHFVGVTGEFAVPTTNNSCGEFPG